MAIDGKGNLFGVDFSALQRGAHELLSPRLRRERDAQRITDVSPEVSRLMGLEIDSSSPLLMKVLSEQEVVGLAEGRVRTVRVLLPGQDDYDAMQIGESIEVTGTHPMHANSTRRGLEQTKRWVNLVVVSNKNPLLEGDEDIMRLLLQQKSGDNSLGVSPGKYVKLGMQAFRQLSQAWQQEHPQPASQ